MFSRRRYIRCFYLTTIVGCLVGCNTSNNEIVISGSITNLPDGKIYICDARQINNVYDSTNSYNGNFTFRIKPGKNFVPDIASIYYTDLSSGIGKSPLIINVNSSISNTSKTLSFETAFFLEKGLTRLYGDLRSKEKITLHGGQETRLMYKFKGQFGYLAIGDKDQRERAISFYETTIKKNPGSFFLLRGVAANKEQYEKNEILKLFTNFKDPLQASVLGSEIKRYTAELVEPGQPYPDLSMRDLENNKVLLFDTSAKLSLLVFWASWCGPCRKEIPQLKELYHSYARSELQIKSISIDENRDNWLSAVNKEKMPWPQYLADSGMIKKMKSIFRFSAIPAVVLADIKKIKIMSVIGYADNNVEYYKASIDSILKNTVK